MLEIGQIVYRYISCFPSYVFRYEVVAIHQYKDMKQYHVKCLSCTHSGDNCELLIAPLEADRLSFVQCLNHRGDDFGEDDHTYWHKYGEPFFLSEEKALFEKMKQVSTEKISDIEKVKANLYAHEKRLSDIDAEIENYKSLLEKPHDR